MKAQKKERTHEFFERWARHHGMKPVCRVVEKGGDILIADSGQRIVEGERGGYVRAFYRTGYAIERPGDKGVWIMSQAETEVFDPQMLSRTERGRQEHRVNECLDYARKHLKQLLTVGLFEDRGERRIPRP